MSAAEKLAVMASKAAEKAKAENDRKRADWARVQEAIPDWANFVVQMRKDDTTARLLHTELDGEIIQTTPEWAELRADLKRNAERAERNMAVERIR
jgi:hypothetical protein